MVTRYGNAHVYRYQNVVYCLVDICAYNLNIYVRGVTSRN